MNGRDGILKSGGVGSRRWSLARVAWLALALAGCGGKPLKANAERDAETLAPPDGLAAAPVRELDASRTQADAADTAAERGADQAVADGGRADTAAEAAVDARDVSASADGDAGLWTPSVASCPDRGGVPFEPEPAPAVSASSPLVSRLDRGDPTGTVVQLTGAPPSMVATSDGQLSLPSVPDGTYGLTLALGAWEETIPALEISGGKPFIIDGSPFPLGQIELQRAHRLITGSSDEVVFDTSAAAGALVYSRYAKSAGTASLVPAAGGTPTTIASGWVSHALFVENGKRIAIVMLSGNTLLDGSIDLVDSATAARTTLATGVPIGAGEYLFAPERFGYYVESTLALDLVIERLDVGDRFTVSDVNNVWQQSPNKRWLAVYTAGSGLRTVDLDTGTVHFVSSRPVNNFEFTADSQLVVFSDQIAIYSADASTGTVTQLAESNEYLLSPDGRLVLVQPSITSPLQVVPVTGGAPVTVTVDVSAASVPTNVFSKDGAFIFYQIVNAFKAASTAQLDVQILTTAGNGRVIDYVPASKTVYFIADGAYVEGEGFTSDFYRMPLDHSGPRETLATRLGMFSGPVSSPSGRYIAYGAPDAASSRSILNIIDTSTGATMPIAYVTTGLVTFSPDESWVFLVDDSSTARLGRLSDGLTYPLTSGPSLANGAKFSPSGDRVMYGVNGVLVTAPVQPCPLPTFVARNTSGARWVTDRALALFRTAVAAPFSFANGLYLVPVP
jgi:WD40 repeat protein